MTQVRRFDHVAIAVADMHRAVHMYEHVLGGEFISGGDDEPLAVRTLQLRYPPGTKVELMMPLTTDCYLQRFIDKHGGGFHHATMFVDDLTRAIEDLTAEGFEVVDTDMESSFWKETFVRPSSGFGALLQLATVDREDRWQTPAEEFGIEDVLAGRVVWRNGVAEPKADTVS